MRGIFERRGGTRAPRGTGRARAGLLALSLAGLALAGGCEDEVERFDATDPARGPGQLVGGDGPLNEGVFPGGDDALPAPRSVALPDDALPPDCDGECQAFCASQALDNPVNRGLCSSLWGVGLQPRPVVPREACRRLFVDLVGRFPTDAEAAATCDGRSFGEVARQLIDSDDFVHVNQRRWADALLYNNQAVSIERIYDMDELVGKVYRGLVPYDQLAAVVSAHPVLTRRYATSGDRVEALFRLFLGRPPFADERSDMARLYTLWDNGYYDHPVLGMRLPDGVIRYRCIGDDGKPHPITRGECTSVLWGYNELILEPDLRASDGQMWSGLLRPEEWERLQLPGRILAGQLAFWEHAADEALNLYLGYDLGALVPEVRDALVRYLLEMNGDVRALHYAVVTSAAYLQSSTGATDRDYRWTVGPLKQVDAEPWIDSVKATTGFALSRCDHRLSQPDTVMNTGTLSTLALVQASDWELDDRGRIVGDYRDLASTLGGCPSNEASGRFKTVSILTTATQEAFVAEVCNPGLSKDRPGADVARLLPPGMNPSLQLTRDVAAEVTTWQMAQFFARAPTKAELDEVREAADQCAPKPCTAEAFARPMCFVLLSSAEMLFY